MDLGRDFCGFDPGFGPPAEKVDAILFGLGGGGGGGGVVARAREKEEDLGEEE